MTSMKVLAEMTEAELRDLLNRVGTAITHELPGALFCCLLFNEPKSAQYVSNCQRSDVILALREAADRLEHQQDRPR
jgi:hypothetical protein